MTEGKETHESFFARDNVQRWRFIGEGGKGAKGTLINDEKVAEPWVIPTLKDELTIAVDNTTDVADDPLRPVIKDAGQEFEVLLAGLQEIAREVQPLDSGYRARIVEYIKGKTARGLLVRRRIAVARDESAVVDKVLRDPEL
jgi:hypothetical protein